MDPIVCKASDSDEYLGMFQVVIDSLLIDVMLSAVDHTAGRTVCGKWCTASTRRSMRSHTE